MFASARDKLLQKLFRKKQAYRAVFQAPNGMLHAQAEVVLRDLAHYCHAMQPPLVKDAHGRVDPIASAQMLGRHEVWSRIQGFIHLPYKEQTALAVPAFDNTEDDSL